MIKVMNNRNRMNMSKQIRTKEQMIMKLSSRNRIKRIRLNLKLIQRMRMLFNKNNKIQKIKKLKIIVKYRKKIRNRKINKKKKKNNNQCIDILKI